MIRRWLLVLLLVVFIGVVITRRAEIEQLLRTLAQGPWPWVLGALACQLVYFLVLTASYQAAAAAVGVASRLQTLLPVTLGAIVVNLLAPTGGGSCISSRLVIPRQLDGPSLPRHPYSFFFHSEDAVSTVHLEHWLTLGLALLFLALLVELSHFPRWHPTPPPTKHRSPRPLRPRTPNDCPFC